MGIVMRPFRGYRPRPELAERVASPPYDVLSSEEARRMAAGEPLSFLHVVKPEIDLPEGTDLYDDRVYAKGAENLKKLLAEAFIQDDRPCFYLYRQRMGDHVQAGIVGCVGIDDYVEDRIKKHELTRADKEADRTRHVETLNAHTGPVFLTYRARAELNAVTKEVEAGEPAYDFTSADGVGHAFWVIDGAETIDAIRRAFADLSCAYVADGHHRSASAVKVGLKRRAENPNHTGEEEYNFFMAVLFPHDRLKIMDYNRVVKDLNGRDTERLLSEISGAFEVVSSSKRVKPTRSREFGMCLQGRWYRLTARPGTYDGTDPVQSLDVSILQNNLLGPVLGIQDPRKDARIDFVGGIRGLEELERRVQGGWAVAFALHPTSIEQLMAIADAGKTMPPKSTWFEPKLRSGLVIHLLE